MSSPHDAALTSRSRPGHRVGGPSRAQRVVLREPLAIETPPRVPPFTVEIEYDEKFSPRPYIVSPRAGGVETICTARVFGAEACARSYATSLIESAKLGVLILVSEPDRGDELHAKGCPGLTTAGNCPAECALEGRPAPWGDWDYSWLPPWALEELQRIHSGPLCPICCLPHP